MTGSAALRQKAGIVGGGLIGGGWAARFLLHGWDVAVFDPHPDTADRVAEILENARRFLPALADYPMPAEGEVSVVETLADAVADTVWVQESVSEDLAYAGTAMAAGLHLAVGHGHHARGHYGGHHHPLRHHGGHHALRHGHHHGPFSTPPAPHGHHGRHGTLGDVRFLGHRPVHETPVPEGCRRVSKVGRDSHGGRARLGGTLCHDAHGRPYIVEGSRYVIEYL